MHNSRLNRMREHGSCNLYHVTMTRAEMEYDDDHFGLGYYDGANGELTHAFWAEQKGELGPYPIKWITYQNQEQFLELMALLKGLGDQVRSIRIREPANIQIQDLILQPSRHHHLTKKSEFEQKFGLFGSHQWRINDLVACMKKTHLKGRESVSFNLKLTDPIEKYLPSDSEWRGISGDYLVNLGANSYAEKGQNDSLPTLTTTVNAFTRMWLGVRSATGLAITDELSAPQELLEKLDWVLNLPAPKTDWDF